MAKAIFDEESEELMPAKHWLLMRSGVMSVLVGLRARGLKGQGVC